MMGKRSPLEVLRRYTQNSVQSSPVQCRAVQCGEGRRAQSNALSLESICVQCSAVPRAHHFIDVWKPRQDRWQDSVQCGIRYLAVIGVSLIIPKSRKASRPSGVARRRRGEITNGGGEFTGEGSAFPPGWG
eukprot:817757-Prorocentrum_minimum.AAC.7